MQIALRMWGWPQDKIGIQESMSLNTFPRLQPWKPAGTRRRLPGWSFLSVSYSERQVRVWVPPVLQRRVVASCLICLFPGTASFSSSPQPFRFSGLSGPLECALFRKGERGILQIGSRGQRAGVRKAMENQEFWVPKHNPRDRDARLPLGPAGLPRAERSRSGGIFSNSSRYFKGKVTSRSKR